jgi:hypothetical protein
LASTFAVEGELACHTVGKMISVIPNGTNPDAVAQILVMDLIVLFVEESGRSSNRLEDLFLFLENQEKDYHV